MNMITEQKLREPFNKLASIFSNMGKVKSRNISLLALSLLKSNTANTYSLARGLASITNQNFNTCEKRVNRFLNNQNFQVNDSLFRCHKNLIFAALKKMNLINKVIFINVDFTTFLQMNS